MREFVACPFRRRQAEAPPSAADILPEDRRYAIERAHAAYAAGGHPVGYWPVTHNAHATLLARHDRAVAAGFGDPKAAAHV